MYLISEVILNIIKNNRVVRWWKDTFSDPVEVSYPNRPKLLLSSNMSDVEKFLTPESIEIYKLYREKVVHEDTLVN